MPVEMSVYKTPINVAPTDALVSVYRRAAMKSGLCDAFGIPPEKLAVNIDREHISKELVADFPGMNNLRRLYANLRNEYAKIAKKIRIEKEIREITSPRIA